MKEGGSRLMKEARTAATGLKGTPDGHEHGLTALVQQQVTARLAAYADERERAGLPAEDEAARRATVGRLLAEELGRQRRLALAEGRAMPDTAAEERIVQTVRNALFGTGDLQRLLADRDIENICVNGCDVVWVKDVLGAWRREAPVAGTDEELVELVRTLAARAGGEERRFDRGMPRLNLQLPDGSRLFAVMAVTGRVSLTIRRHRFPAASMAELVRLGVCDEQLAAFLKALVRARKNIVIGGGTNVGKTTVLRAFAHEIPPEERLVTIEDTFELGLDADPVAHQNVVAIQAREPNIEGQGGVDQAELVRWGLRMSPDRVIVGEIRGAEVIPMCNAMSQGNDGSLSTVHASTSRGVFTKFASYAAQSPERLTLEATNLMVASAVHFVVHLGWDRRGYRVIDSVREVLDADGDRVVSNEIYRPGAGGRAEPATPVRSDTLDDLVAAGLDPRVASGCLQSWGGGVSVPIDSGSLLGAAVACGTVFGLGLVAIGYGAVRRPGRERRRSGSMWWALRARVPACLSTRCLVAAATTGAVTGALTGWPVAAVLTSVGWLTLPGLLGGDRAAARRTERMEALALWTEMLRDTLSAAAGLEQAVLVTADIAPAALKQELGNLAAAVRSGRPLPASLRAFATAVADPLADLTVAALAMAASQQSGRLGPLLGELAESVREQVAMRQRIDAGRASVRAAVRVTVITTLGMVLGLVVFNRSYLDPFDSATGQAVLAVVGALFAASFGGLTVIGRIEEPVRLIDQPPAGAAAGTASGGSR